ncbi:unnamed protein product [Didymodactylos carnosus]|uniref:F-box domain-containing protein n=1 Tax=Didymodactylos carnosus TaxID=1234261 RepID=A0A8S2RNJ3_9BILA|nr:unnamed protein product [Didymodactylos carnosus]CAF4172015.1 unnamed protein product [Didymodactylos carnosus]
MSKRSLAQQTQDNDNEIPAKQSRIAAVVLVASHITSYECLPNELNLEIFEYLSLFNILHSFTNLNQRYSSLVYSYQQHIDLTSPISCEQFNNFLQKILPAIDAYQIQTVKLSNRYTYKQIQLFTSLFKIRQFQELKTIHLIEPTLNDLQEILPNVGISVRNLILEIHQQQQFDFVYDNLPLTIAKLIIETNQQYFRYKIA